ncbi:dienelactone hydrolase family protein [uncultured Thiodictyon sp.]|uniref:dienelactone hydrolase family protein n=1 Tax=uncultured Thiodictyon sp. TaxID=1846217 RepID=UPI0025DAAF1B|nr:dienelactone hydrolase family protein [uncultured Thiodictyon sp.]
MLTGYLTDDDAQTGKRPGVLVAHEWWGLNDCAKQRARMLAELGYVAFAADLYGDLKVTTHAADAQGWMTQITANQAAWRPGGLAAKSSMLPVTRIRPLTTAMAAGAPGDSASSARDSPRGNPLAPRRVGPPPGGRLAVS